MMIRLLLCLCFAFVPASLFAQNWYQVNIVVFENRQGVAAGEVLTQPEGLRFETPVNAVDLDALDENGDVQGFQRTTIIDQEFNGVVASLQRSPSYKVLLVKSWRQPGLARNKALPVLIRGGDTFGQHHRLEGTVRVVLSRYLHLETDLWLGEFTQTEAPAATGLESVVILEDGTRVVEPAPVWFEPTRLIRMQESRRMRSKELHYLDHPSLGVISKIIPLQGNL